MDMECETVEEQTMDKAERTENKDKNSSGLKTLRDDMSTHQISADSPVSREQGLVRSSTGVQESIESGVVESVEMETCAGNGTAVNDDEDSNVEEYEDSGGHNTLDDIAFDTDDCDASNARFSNGHYIVDSIEHDNDDPAANNNTTPIGHDNTTHNTKDTSVNRLATSKEDAFNGTLQNPTSTKNNENPVEEPQATSSPPELDSDHSEDSVETSGSTDTEMEQWKESDEMSDTTEVGVPVQSLNLNDVDIKPFNFLGCPDKVRQRILEFALINKKQIKPYYSFGSIEVAAHNAVEENYSNLPAAFAGNRELIEQTTTILYGENAFHLHHPKVALWWLQRLGPTNIPKLKYLAITLGEGVLDHFLTRQETIWRKVFRLLLTNHNLLSLSVNFKHWTRRPCPEDGLGPESNHVLEARFAVLRTLFRFRGLERAVIRPGPFVGEVYAEILASALVLSEGETSEEIEEVEGEIRWPERRKYSFT